LLGVVFSGACCRPDLFGGGSGYLLANVQLPDAASLQETDKTNKVVEEIIKEYTGVESVTTITGFSLLTSAYATNTGFFFIWLKPWEERSKSEHAFEIAKSLNRQLAAQVPNAQSAAFGPPAIAGLGTGAGFSMMIQDREGRSAQFLAESTQKFLEAARKRPEIGRAMTMYRASVPQIFAKIDREKTLKQGVSLADLNQAFGAFMGGSYVNDFLKRLELL
jgi:HAE1 family hydrophobic/amphiphilic exporter-1